MNRKEWLECNSEVKWRWYRACEEIRKTLKYNQDSNATHKHHLFDTPEQISYNNEHYEMWGFNEDGTFEYGKYIIFVTPEEHSQIHASSDETNEKRRIAMKKKWNDEDYRKFWLEQHAQSLTEDVLKQISDAAKSQWADDVIRDRRIEGLKRSWQGDSGNLRRESVSNKIKSLWLDDEYRQLMSDKAKSIWENPEHRAIISQKVSGENNGMYGKRHSDETKEKLREAHLGKRLSEEHKKKIGEFNKNKIVSDETRRKVSESNKAIYKIISAMYREYKSTGGELKWRDFLKNICSKDKFHHG